MLRNTLLMTSLVAALLPACKWTEFDDLADQTWAHSQGKPGVNSTDYGLELLPVQHAGDGAKIAVIGANEPSFSTLVYDHAGNSVLGPAPIDLNKEYTINSIPDSPALVGDPETDNVALVIPSTEGRTVVLSGSADALVELTVNDPKPNTATYIPSGTAGTESALLVTGTGTFHGIAAQTASTCLAIDDLAAPLNAVAMTAVGSNVVVWTDGGKLLQYDAATVQGTCGAGSGSAAASPVGAAINTGFVPGSRSKLIPLGGTFVLLVGIPTMDGPGQIVVYDLSTGNPTNTPTTPMSLRSAAFGTVNGTTYLALGFPARAVQNVSAGQVEVHEVDLTTHVVKDAIALTLNDAQPEANQSYGQAVAITHFNNDAIFIVAGDNEIYSYYETLLYSDTRK